jgi:hypothetical protein
MSRLIVHAVGPHGPFVVRGQTAKSLLALVKAGERGCSALEVSSWALRFAAYCHELRKNHGLEIATLPENHDGGWHGRHVLRTPVEILAIIDASERKAA